MKTKYLFVALIIIVSGCNRNSNQTVVENSEIIVTQVLTKEQQDKLTPDEVINRLKEGNLEFINDRLTIRNNSERIRQAALGQYPKAVILSCLDSRVPVEDVFHKGIGDLFVARVAGNIVNEDILASLEYACKVSGSKVIVVLGHEYCGAIKSAIDNVQLGNITALLAKIQPAVKQARLHFTGEATSKNALFVEAVCDENVKLAMQQINTQSPVLKDMLDKGEIKIIGGVYDIKTGKVLFF